MPQLTPNTMIPLHCRTQCHRRSNPTRSSTDPHPPVQMLVKELEGATLAPTQGQILLIQHKACLRSLHMPLQTLSTMSPLHCRRKFHRKCSLRHSST
mmetsp:Transcript_2612/g.6569  ORF Transcript_2612/g.6569 Transcript_2612/m.6569 type:complete len:97 (-) Transcript_2612:976-1266(-)